MPFAPADEQSVPIVFDGDSRTGRWLIVARLGPVALGFMAWGLHRRRTRPRATS